MEDNNKDKDCSKYLCLIRRSPGFEERLELKVRQVADEMATTESKPSAQLFAVAMESVLNDYEWVRGEYCHWMFSTPSKSTPADAESESKGSNFLKRLTAYGVHDLSLKK